MTIQELMEKRAKVWEAAKNFVDTVIVLWWRTRCSVRIIPD